MSDMKLPEWTNMPAPKCILKISWEDIYIRAWEQGKILTIEQVSNAFEKAVSNGSNDSIMLSFWANIDYAISEATNES